MFLGEKKFRVMDGLVGPDISDTAPESSYRTAERTDYSGSRGLSTFDISASEFTVSQLKKMASDIEERRLSYDKVPAKQQMNWMVDYYRITSPNPEKRKTWEAARNSVNSEGEPSAEQAIAGIATLRVDVASGGDIASTGELSGEAKEILETHSKNLNKISRKIEKALENGRLGANKFTWGELDFIKCEQEIQDGVLAFMTEGSLLYKNADLKADLNELFKNVGLARKAYDNTLRVEGHVHGETGRRKEVKWFLAEMTRLATDCGIIDILNNPEIIESKEFKDKVQGASATELLKMYEAEPKDEAMNRAIIVHALMENYVYKSEFIFTRSEEGKYSLEALANESDEQKKSREELQAILDTVDAEYIDGYRMNATLENVDYDKNEVISPRGIANAIIKKYEIKYEDGGTPKYEDLLDDSRKSDLKGVINEMISKAESDEEKQDLQYLLDLADVKQKDFLKDMQHIANFKMISSGFLEDGDFWKLLGEDGEGRNIEQFIEKVLTANSGMNMVWLLAVSIYAMFKGKGKEVFAVTGLVLGAQTAEEMFTGSDAHKKVVDLFKEISPEFGDMVEGFIGMTPFGKPKYEIKHMSDEYESTYIDLYKKNSKKLKEEEFSKAMAEEDFAQIYGQLLANENFRNMSITEIERKMATTASVNGDDFLGKGGNGIDKYQKSLLDTSGDDISLTDSRSINEGQVRLVIEALLRENEGSDDHGIDLFANGASEGLTIIGGEQFQGANEAVSKAFDNISPDNSKREQIKDIMHIGEAWTFENAKIMVGADDGEVQVSSMIKNLKQLAPGVGEHKEEIIALITALEGLKAAIGFDTEKEEFLDDAVDGADKGILGAEGALKRFVNMGAGLATAVGGYVGFDKFSVPELESVTMSELDEKITEGEKLLTEYRESIFSEVQKIEAIDSGEVPYPLAFTQTSNDVLILNNIDDIINTNIKRFVITDSNGQKHVLNLKEKDIKNILKGSTSAINPPRTTPSTTAIIPLQTEATSEITSHIRMLLEYKTIREKKIGGDGKAQTLEIMRIDTINILRELDDMEVSLQTLTYKHESLDAYYDAVLRNYDNIAKLKRYASVSVSPETPEAKVKARANELSQNITEMNKNIGDYLRTTFAENTPAITSPGPVSTVTTPAVTTKYGNLSSALRDGLITADNIGKYEQDFEYLKSSLIDDNLPTTFQNWVKKKYNGIEFAHDFEMTETSKLGLIATLLYDNESDVEKTKKGFEAYTKRVTDLEKKLKAVREALEDVEEQALSDEVNSLLLGLPSTYDSTNVQTFIDGIEKISEKDEDGDFSDEIQGKIDMYMKSLAVSVVVNDPNITQKKKDFDKLKKEIGSFAHGYDILSLDTDAENAFEERYGIVFSDKMKKEFMLRNGTDPIVAEMYEKSGLTAYLTSGSNIPFASGAGRNINRGDLQREDISTIIRLLNRAINYHSAGTFQEQLIGYKEDIEKEIDIRIDGYIGRFFK